MNKTLKKTLLGGTLAIATTFAVLPFFGQCGNVAASAQSYVHPVLTSTDLSSAQVSFKGATQDDELMGLTPTFSTNLGAFYSSLAPRYAYMYYHGDIDTNYATFSDVVRADDINGGYSWTVSLADNWVIAPNKYESPSVVADNMTCYKFQQFLLQDENSERLPVKELKIELDGSYVIPLKDNDVEQSTSYFDDMVLQVWGEYAVIDVSFEGWDFSSKSWVEMSFTQSYVDNPYLTTLDLSTIQDEYRLGREPYIYSWAPSPDSIGRIYGNYIRNLSIHAYVNDQNEDSLTSFSITYLPDRMSYPTGFTDLEEALWEDIVGDVLYIDEADPVAPIFDTVGSFFRMELFPGFSLSGLLSVVFGLALFFILLKVFLGG